MHKVLFIEDDGPTAMIYKENFAKKFDVVIAPTGAEGITTAIKQMPHLIILDLMLGGGMNGFDVLRELKQHQEVKKIPVIVLTNLAEQEAAVKDAGAAECFVKANTSIGKVGEIIESYLK